MIPPHLFYQIYLPFFEQNYCTPPKCGELLESQTMLESCNKTQVGGQWCVEQGRRKQMLLFNDASMKDQSNNPSHDEQTE